MHYSNHKVKQWQYRINGKQDAIFMFKNTEIGQHTYDHKINLNKISKEGSCLMERLI